MMAYKKYIVKQGDCISSIAFKYGFFPDTIWNDSKNSKLKQDRKDPNVLMPGDEVYIRDKEEKEESCASGKKHRFKRKGVPEKFRLQLAYGGKPRAHVAYVLEVDGILMNGETDENGMIECDISPEAHHGQLRLSEDEVYDFQFGTLAPVTEDAGVSARLCNLGFLEPDERDDVKRIADAIYEFQRRQGLEPTGKVDEETESKLLSVHGC